MPLQIALTAFLALSGLLCSCVNQDYDLSKPIDTTINIQGDISIPVGSSEFIKIGDFLEIEESEDGIRCDETTGDYYLSFASSESLSADFKFDEISIGKLEQTNDLLVSIPTAGFTTAVTPGSASLFATVPPFNYDLPTGSKMSVSIDKAFDEESIVELKKIVTQAPLSVRFNISTGAIQLCAGTKIILPEYLTAGKQNASDARFSISGSTITITSPIKVSAGTSTSIDLNITEINFDKMPSGMGLVTVSGKRRFVIKDEVTMAGRITVDPADFTSVPGSLVLAVNTVMNDIVVKTTTARVNTSYNVAKQTVSVGELPDFLTSEGVTLDIWNPILGVEVDNQTPFTASISAQINAYKGQETTPYASLGIGQGEEKVLLTTGVSKIYVSRQGTHPGQDGGLDIRKPEIGDILSQVPSSIGIEQIAIKSDPEEYITFDHSRKYSCAVEYNFRADLAFGRNFKLEYTPEDIKGLGGSLGLGEGMSIDITSLSLKFNMVSTVPVEFDLSAVPVDVDGNVITGAKVSVEGSIKAGKTGEESTSPIVLTVSADNDALKKLDGIRLTVSGSSNEAVEGVTLNKEQGIRLTDIKARLVGGFTTNLE